jgi:hypothetical protein
MKKTVFQIAVTVMLLLMGCSKNELIEEASENSQLKRGSIGSSGTTSITFIGNSVVGDFFTLTEIADNSKIMKSGKISGSITGYGKINPALSSYSFSTCLGKENPEYKYTYPNNQINRACTHMYDMNGTAKICITTSDYFEITFTKALLVPYNYEAGFWGLNEPPFFGALFGCPMSYQGEAIIISGAGKLGAFIGRKLQIGGGDGRTFNRITGEVKNLRFRIL